MRIFDFCIISLLVQLFYTYKIRELKKIRNGNISMMLSFYAQKHDLSKM